MEIVDSLSASSLFNFSQTNFFRRTMTTTLRFMLVVAASLAVSSGLDVQEGDDVRLECRFPAGIAAKASSIYWLRQNRGGHDNAAINDTPYEQNYE